jgi:hypothetical protein
MVKSEGMPKAQAKAPFVGAITVVNEPDKSLGYRSHF